MPKLGVRGIGWSLSGDVMLVRGMSGEGAGVGYWMDSLIRAWPFGAWMDGVPILGEVVAREVGLTLIIMSSCYVENSTLTSQMFDLQPRIAGISCQRLLKWRF